jgi:Holliday junction DNA helicase RuvB
VIIENFKGGPVGLGTISASIHEDRDSIEEIIEPYLIQKGLLVRTPRGRIATPLAQAHFKDKLSDSRHLPLNPTLFDSQ